MHRAFLFLHEIGKNVPYRHLGQQIILCDRTECCLQRPLCYIKISPLGHFVIFIYIGQFRLPYFFALGTAHSRKNDRPFGRLPDYRCIRNVQFPTSMFIHLSAAFRTDLLERPCVSACYLIVFYAVFELGFHRYDVRVLQLERCCHTCHYFSSSQEKGCISSPFLNVYVLCNGLIFSLDEPPDTLIDPAGPASCSYPQGHK